MAAAMESSCVTVSTSSHAPLVITRGLSVGGAGKQLKPFQFHLGIVFTAAHAYCMKYSTYLPSMCHVALAPLEWNVLRLNLRAFLSSTPLGSISFIISATMLRGTWI